MGGGLRPRESRGLAQRAAPCDPRRQLQRALVPAPARQRGRGRLGCSYTGGSGAPGRATAARAKGGTAHVASHAKAAPRRGVWVSKSFYGAELVRRRRQRALRVGTPRPFVLGLRPTPPACGLLPPHPPGLAPPQRHTPGLRLTPPACALLPPTSQDWRLPNATHPEWTDTGALTVVKADLKAGTAPGQPARGPRIAVRARRHANPRANPRPAFQPRIRPFGIQPLQSRRLASIRASPGFATLAPPLLLPRHRRAYLRGPCVLARHVRTRAPEHKRAHKY